MKTIARMIEDYPRCIVAVTVVVTAFFLAVIATRYEPKKDLFANELPTAEERANDWIFQSMRWVLGFGEEHHRNLEEVQKHFPNREVVKVRVSSTHQNGIWNPETLRIGAALVHGGESIPGVRDGETYSLFGLTTIEENEAGERIEQKLIDNLPTTDEAVARWRMRMEGNPLVTKHRLVWNNGTALVVTFFLKDGYEQTVVTDGFDTVLASLADTHHEFHLMGEPPLNERIRRGIEGNTYLIPIAFVLTFFFAGVFLRSIRKRGFILVGIATLFTVIWTVGTSVLLGIPQSVVLSVAPVVMMALADDPTVQLVHSYRGNVALIITSLGRTIWFTVATTVAGFATLVTFGIASIENFGITIAIGSLYSFWMAVCWNGALLVLFPRLGEVPETQGRFGRWTTTIDKAVTHVLHRVMHAVLKYPKQIIGIHTIVVLAGIIIVIVTLTVGDNPMKLAPHDDPMRLAEQPFTEHGGFKAEELVLEVGNNLDPFVLGLIAEAQVEFEELAGTYTQSGADLAAYCNYLHETGAPSSFRRPETRRAVENQLRLYVAPRDRQKYFKGTTLLRVVVMVKTLDQREQMRLHARFDERLTALVQTRLTTATPEERVALGNIRWWWGGNSVVFWITMTEYVAIGKILNIATAIPLIFLLCWWHFGSWRLALLALVPLTSATITTFAVMGLLGIRLTIATSVIVGVATGIGADYAVHFIDRFREERRNGYSIDIALFVAITETGKSILTDSFSMSLGFLVLLGSTFTPLRDMGLLIALNMQGCVWVTILTMPAIISFWRALFERLCPEEKRS